MKIQDILKEDQDFKLGDTVVLELDDVIIEANIIDIENNNVILEFDEFAMMLLEKFNTVNEGSNQDFGVFRKIHNDVSEDQWVPLTEPTGTSKPRPNDRGTPVYTPTPVPSKIKPSVSNTTQLTKPMSPNKVKPSTTMGTYKGGVWTADPPKKGEIGVPAPNALDEAEYQGRKVQLGKPMKGDVKKSKVYVKGPKGNVVKVNFGDKNMKIKKNIPARRKSFRARHNCANPGPRWKARYWSCKSW